MKTEVSTAATFISSLLRTKGSLTEDELHLFTETLFSALLEHYHHHWFPQAPCRGSGYRCLRINHKMDPLIGNAGSAVGLTQEQLFSLLPKELTLWVDPYEVSYRIGEDGSTCVLYESSPAQPKCATSADTSGHYKEEQILRRSNRSKGFSIMDVLSLRGFTPKPTL
ncbi:protein BTG1-like [Xyrauchen texanus]|uniref:protein BTG1-like n=1 Tax=Xyrauchen texanus TaxID=154827 RepID=UPI0022421860|nr:protein BTG1-like [Xyrauchen texanus]